MSIWISGILGALFSNITYYYLFSKIDKETKNISYYGLILCIIVSIFTGYTIYFSTGFRSIIVVSSIMVILKLAYKQNWEKTIITTFFIHIVCGLSEMIVGVTLMSVFNINLQNFTNNFLGIVAINLLVMSFSIVLFQIKIIRKIIESVINWYNNKSLISLVVTVIIASMAILFLLYRNIQGFATIIEFLFNNIFVIGMIYLVVCFFIEKSSNAKIKNEYNLLLNYAKTYETEIIQKSKWQHEYKNQLLIIKDKINPENQKAIKYINKLLKDKPSHENSQWLEKLTKFPDIGIKGLLHYKICEMIKNGIQVYVDVIDEDMIPSNLPEKILEDNLQDISMALGVYLDNAMHAARDSDKKYLIVEFKCTKEQIIFQISNTYKGTIQIEKMKQDGFSTKGKNHGYGLSIVRDILAKNDNLSQEKEINGMYYVQRLIINIKK